MLLMRTLALTIELIVVVVTFRTKMRKCHAYFHYNLRLNTKTENAMRMAKPQPVTDNHATKNALLHSKLRRVCVLLRVFREIRTLTILPHTRTNGTTK